jgi:hypothetical protein
VTLSLTLPQKQLPSYDRSVIVTPLRLRAATALYAATIPSLAFKPALHVHYQESVLPIRDGLPKMRDIPKEMGGSGETLAE